MWGRDSRLTTPAQTAHVSNYIATCMYKAHYNLPIVLSIHPVICYHNCNLFMLCVVIQTVQVLIVFLTQVREAGLPGPMDPALIAVGTGPEQAPGPAPLLTNLNAVLVTAPSLKPVKNANAAVSRLCLASLL